MKQKITICATIHCPPPQTFNLFEAVLILQRGGVAYFGASGSAAINYFHAFTEVAPLACYPWPHDKSYQHYNLQPSRQNCYGHGRGSLQGVPAVCIRALDWVGRAATGSAEAEINTGDLAGDRYRVSRWTRTWRSGSFK